VQEEYDKKLGRKFYRTYKDSVLAFSDLKDVQQMPQNAVRDDQAAQ
jgi:hypothetical protein